MGRSVWDSGGGRIVGGDGHDEYLNIIPHMNTRYTKMISHTMHTDTFTHTNMHINTQQHTYGGADALPSLCCASYTTSITRCLLWGGRGASLARVPAACACCALLATTPCVLLVTTPRCVLLATACILPIIPPAPPPGAVVSIRLPVNVCAGVYFITRMCHTHTTSPGGQCIIPYTTQHGHNPPTPPPSYRGVCTIAGYPSHHPVLMVVNTPPPPCHAHHQHRHWMPVCCKTDPRVLLLLHFALHSWGRLVVGVACQAPAHSHEGGCGGGGSSHGTLRNWHGLMMAGVAAPLPGVTIWA